MYFKRIGAAYKGGVLKFALDASLSAGGLEIFLDGLSVSSPLTRFDPRFNLKGLGIRYGNPTMEISGAFLREKKTDPKLGAYDEFSGIALLKTQAFTLGAIGSYAYVNGKPSLFIYGALNRPLGGPAFCFVTGLSVGFGYNRKLRMPSIDKVFEFPLVAQVMNGGSLPTAPNQDTLTDVLKELNAYVPISEGSLFLAAGIRFTTFKLLDTTLLLSASFGRRFELNLLGVSTLSVPPKAGKTTSLAKVKMALKGAYIPDEGFVGLRGKLTPDSYILSRKCRLSGGFAYYAWYTGPHGGDFVITMGGYHPRFRKPAHYPSVPRLSINWRLSSNIHIKGNCYFALCAHAFMAGGRLEAVYQKGNLKAWFKASADFLISWKPYHYEASIRVNIGGSYKFKGLFGTRRISVDVGSTLEIWGPEFGGHASVDLWVTSVSISFGARRPAGPKAIGWNTFKQSFLPEKNLCSVSVSAGLVSQGTDEK